MVIHTYREPEAAAHRNTGVKVRPVPEGIRVSGIKCVSQQGTGLTFIANLAQRVEFPGAHGACLKSWARRGLIAEFSIGTGHKTGYGLGQHRIAFTN